MDFRIVEKLYAELSGCKCANCCNHCPGKILLHYMTETGIEEFHRQLEANQLPSHIKEIFLSKVKAQ